MRVVMLLAISAGALSAQPKTQESWHRPLANWNQAGAPLPAPPAAEESKASLIARCRLTPPRGTPAEKAVNGADRVPFHNFDRRLVREGVEVVGGMAGSDGMCRPTNYNLFVFVRGRFAGTLSPLAMTSRLDASSAAVRLPLPQITAEFARYAASDPLCCPSSRVTAHYRIERRGAGAVVVPIEVRTTRG